MGPDPNAFTIFGLSIKWYGILIASGMLLAMLIIYKRAPRHKIDPERMIDLSLIVIPLSVIGARLYYVFSNWDYYDGDIMKMLDIRSGGLAIHGGLIIGVMTGIFLARRWQIRPLNLLDLGMPAVVLAQSIGRWGNYFNQEAYGIPTNLPWAINVDGVMVHPTFLYESIWCFLLFLLLSYVDRRRAFEGQVFLLYGILYSFERFFVEWLRIDSLMIGPFRTAQVVSLIVFISFTFLYFYWKRKTDNNNNLFINRRY
jgi:phosphatidylglycerol---prolipoprotein diacylglyceryl transferase